MEVGVRAACRRPDRSERMIQPTELKGLAEKASYGRPSDREHVQDGKPRVFEPSAPAALAFASSGTSSFAKPIHRQPTSSSSMNRRICWRRAIRSVLRTRFPMCWSCATPVTSCIPRRRTFPLCCRSSKPFHSRAILCSIHSAAPGQRSSLSVNCGGTSSALSWTSSTMPSTA
jgi:hypothetical protein